MTSLDVSDDEECHLTDESIKAIAVNCHSIMYLNVAHCLLTDASIKAIAAKCPVLTELDPRTSCENLTDESIKAIAANCTALKGLNAAGCNNVTNDTLDAIAAKGCSVDGGYSRQIPYDNTTSSPREEMMSHGWSTYESLRPYDPESNISTFRCERKSLDIPCYSSTALS